MKRFLALILALSMILVLCACGAGGGKANDGPFKPNGPVTLIVAYKAGNGTDITARILAKYAENLLGRHSRPPTPAPDACAAGAPAPGLQHRLPPARR